MGSLAATDKSSAGERREDDLRSWCQGSSPLDAIVAPWMLELADRQPDDLFQLVQAHGSPLNIVHSEPMERNIRAIKEAAFQRGVDLAVYFARKANKCMTFVDAAFRAGAGIDVASDQELKQALERGVPGEKVICTAAIKPVALVERCIAQGVTLVIDNLCELRRILHIAESRQLTARAAIRLSGFKHDGQKLHSRFGFDVDEVDDLLSRVADLDATRRLLIEGLHFHLDGYCARERVSAIAQCIALVDAFRQQRHHIAYLDMGGGFPMRYLHNETQWNSFWHAHQAALLGVRPPLTYQNHGLGLQVVDDQVVGNRDVYPYYQAAIGPQWLGQILDSPCDGAQTIAKHLIRSNLQLRCEPGRFLLSDCGFTLATVEFTKPHRSGDWFIGLNMNRTQCRTGSADFMVDPIHIPATRQRVGPSISGFLVGTYCTESELILLRRLHFPNGIAEGDLIMLPNTAGYFMHFLESRSHQFDLAKNLTWDDASPGGFQLDDIDLSSGIV